MREDEEYPEGELDSVKDELPGEDASLESPRTGNVPVGLIGPTPTGVGGFMGEATFVLLVDGVGEGLGSCFFSDGEGVEELSTST